MFSPYQFAANTPIMAADLDGAEAELRIFSRTVTESFIKLMDEKGAENALTWVMIHKDETYPESFPDRLRLHLSRNLRSSYFCLPWCHFLSATEAALKARAHKPWQPACFPFIMGKIIVAHPVKDYNGPDDPFYRFGRLLNRAG